MFDRAETHSQWQQAAATLNEMCQIEDGTTGGVNPGDRRALWYLITTLRPASILEIGTHVGASTVHIASALREMTKRDPSYQPRLITVDIEDVNSEAGAWKGYGLPSSPRDMIQAIGCDDLVSFVTQQSVNFLENSPERFDFIFLDGDHAATAVYQEIPRALKLLKKDGVILLHDFFPNNRPLWSNGSLIAGPFTAVSRLRSEGAPIKVLPLGALPWPTKLGSNITSLALVTRDE